MRSYKQVKDVLKRVSAWHTELLEFCGDEVPDDSPYKPLVQYLAAHEAAAKQVLDAYEPTARDTILNTWLQYVPAEGVEEVFLSRDLRDDLTPGQVVGMVMEFDNALVSLYRSLADSANSPLKVQEMFRSLLEMQQWQQLRNAWSIRESDSHATGRG